jgi:pimeloyl-ACP methyl ester carboxylesterase
MQVMSWKVNKSFNRDGIIDDQLAFIEDRGVDILMLQEVRHTGGRWTKYWTEQLAAIGLGGIEHSLDTAAELAESTDPPHDGIDHDNGHITAVTEDWSLSAPDDPPHEALHDGCADTTQFPEKILLSTAETPCGAVELWNARPARRGSRRSRNSRRCLARSPRRARHGETSPATSTLRRPSSPTARRSRSDPGVDHPSPLCRPFSRHPPTRPRASGPGPPGQDKLMFTGIEPRVMDVALPEGVSARRVDTDRLETNVLVAGDPDGRPVCLVHGNVSSARFWAELMADMPERYRLIAPDLRGYGDSERKPVDATRGVRPFTEDLEALFDALDLESVALVGWSIGGGVAMQYAIDHPEALTALVLVSTMSPYGFGGTTRDGTPCQPDHAGTGGGLANDEFVERLAEGDTTAESDASPRSVMNAFYFGPGVDLDPGTADAYVESMCATAVGDDNYPGDAVASERWPGIAPGERGVLNAVSPKYFDSSGLADIDPKPPVLWVRGDADSIVSDSSLFDAGFLGQAGELPDWPGEEAYPPQPMTAQTRDVLEAYAEQGGSYTEEVFADVGHSPHVERPGRFRAVLTEFLNG